ncbi:glycosyl hydrolase [Desulfotomaculum copahuensis]|uniref:GH26 domain-containing protein n=1 Tax=Desulfotomaculum copahuensis TaxID=1838280 RepID=A0A1B7LB96_9FIRM|nr:glycosyl hydrolase [Desulfotomaculum copahuensis]OAT79812.1 hypothetical protein A6M21_15305 [Desulfotomaculum copahuensis]
MKKKSCFLLLFVLLLSSCPRCVYAGAVFEPDNGCYTGAYMFDDTRCNADPQNFNLLAGKKQAAFLAYRGYGQPFPSDLAAKVKAAHAALQLALEPNDGLDQVQDDAYLHRFMKDAWKSGIPIFLRFASEMNGPWVAWHGNPWLYQEKWQLVWKVAREEAPNVAMVWVPAETPLSGMMDYYPGSECVDWVGMDIYYDGQYNGEADSSIWHVNPLDSLKYLYYRIPDKPFFIAEFGVAHYEKSSGRNLTARAVNEMCNFYNELPQSFHRVKAVSYFDCDSITFHSEDNDYSLSNGVILNAYKALISPSYYLSDVQGWREYKGYCLPEVRFNGHRFIPVRAYALAENLSVRWNPPNNIVLGKQSYTVNGNDLLVFHSQAWLRESLVLPVGQ